MGGSYPLRGRAAVTPRTSRANVVVIAPHPDDDAIGCGGMLARLAARGARIGVLYVTDGSASHPNSVHFPPAALRDVREGEARRALQRLGVRRAPVFLRAPDSGLAALDGGARSRLTARIAEFIAARNAHIIFAPWPRDPHPDHVVTAELVGAALDSGPRRPALWSYHVWLPVRGTADEHPHPDEAHAVDVALTPLERARKRSAILAHRSQLGQVVDDDPDGFAIDGELLAGWLTPFERFYRRRPLGAGRSKA